MFERDRWLPLRQVPDEGAPGGDVATEAPAEAPQPSGPGSGRSELRQQLEKNFETDRKATEKAAKAPAKGKTAKRVAGGAEIEAPEATEQPAEGTEAPVEGTEGQPAPQATVAAPEGFSAEAKAEWAKTPPNVQAAIVKREADMAKGVEELKGRYSEIDKALQPHMEAIRRHGQTPAKAVEQLFAWFNALAVNPSMAFPALAKSFNLDLNQILAANQQPGQQPQPDGKDQAAQPAGNVPPEIQKYISDMKNELASIKQAFSQEITGVQSQVARQAEEKTNEVLMMWAKDKPHFDAVRQTMASLIQSGTVPLKDGQVDLDGAYDMAVYGMPDVRAKVLAEQAEAQKKAAAEKVAAEKKAQQEQANKARKTAVGVAGGAPGVPGLPGAKPARKKTVRESIEEARQELAE